MYVDDRNMAVEALVVRSRPILGREVVIHPRHINELSHSRRSFQLSMDKQAVSKLPDVEDVPSVADLRAADMQHYGEFPVYWGGAGLWNGTIPADTAQPGPSADARSADRADDYHTQSLDAMNGYEVRDEGGKLRGYLIDFVVDTESWRLTFVVVEDLETAELRALDASQVRRIDWYASSIECGSRAFESARPVHTVLSEEQPPS